MEPGLVNTEDLTFAELMDLASEKAAGLFDSTPDGSIWRECALAKTHLEDAQMRFTRAFARTQGKFDPVDLEKEV